jgi:hypothetical protein
MQAKRIAIVGCATSSLEQAPWKDLSIKMWALPSLHRLWPGLSPRVDLWFELHKKEHAQQFDWWKWALERQPPVMLQEKCPELKRSVAYPREAVEKMFGSYFTSTIAFMLAFAIGRGAEEISIYGVDMMDGDEYVYQRPCVEHLIGIALGRGTKVHIPEVSALLKSPYTYAYDHGAHAKEPTPEQRLMNEVALWRARALNYEKRLKALGEPTELKMYSGNGEDKTAALEG